jgi:hypothetical protein
MINSMAFPRFASGGAVTAGAGGSGSAQNFNVTLNYSGSGSQNDARSMAQMVMSELERMHRRSS